MRSFFNWIYKNPKRSTVFNIIWDFYMVWFFHYCVTLKSYLFTIISTIFVFTYFVFRNLSYYELVKIKDLLEYLLNKSNRKE